MSSPPDQTAERGQGRGRPRNASADAAIRAAVLAELAEGGYDALTIEGVAARAGVSRPTVYRRHPTKAQLVASAVAGALAEANPEAPDSGDAEADLLTVLDRTVRAIRAGLGDAAAALIDPARHDAELAAVLDEALEARRTILRSVLARSAFDGRRHGTVDEAVDAALGLLWFRVLIRRRRLTVADARAACSAAVSSPR